VQTLKNEVNYVGQLRSRVKASYAALQALLLLKFQIGYEDRIARRRFHRFQRAKMPGMPNESFKQDCSLCAE